MSLDFSLYWKKKDETMDDVLDALDKDPNARDLAYGNRCREVVKMLVPDYKESLEMGEDPIVTVENWKKFLGELGRIGPKMEKVYRAYEKKEDLLAGEPDSEFTEKDKKLIIEYEGWWRSTFHENYPTLAFFFSAYYIKEFWNAREQIQKYIDDPDFEVRAFINDQE